MAAPPNPYRMPRHFPALLSLLSLALLPLPACDGSGSASSGAIAPGLEAAKPRAIGDVNRVVVVADPDVLATDVRDSIVYHYEQLYPLMPQPEPMYDVRYMQVEDLLANQARRELRSYLILADLAEPNSPTTRFVERMLGEEKLRAAREDYTRGTTVRSDQWANGQVVIYLYAEGPDRLADLVAQTYNSASQRIAASDAEVLNANIYQAGRNRANVDSLERLVGLRLDIPQDYLVAKAEEGFMWFRRDLRDVIQNIFIGRVPYTGPEQLTRDSAVALRNRIGLDAIQTNTAGSVMSTNDRDLPVLTTQPTLGGVESLAAKGVWEMSDDDMGGPFFTYLIPDEAAGQLYVVDAWVYAPGSKKGKRNYMQQLEKIVETAEL